MNRSKPPPWRPWIIGHSPSEVSDAALPLISGQSGLNLAEVAGLPVRWFSFLFGMRNLFGSVNYRASVAEHERAADRLRPLLEGGRAILLGVDVARAFGIENMPQFVWTMTPAPPLPRLEAAWIPHPSPRSAFWRSRANRDRVGAFLKEEAAQAAAQALDDLLEFEDRPYALVELRTIAGFSLTPSGGSGIVGTQPPPGRLQEG